MIGNLEHGPDETSELKIESNGSERTYERLGVEPGLFGGSSDSRNGLGPAHEREVCRKTNIFS